MERDVITVTLTVALIVVVVLCIINYLLDCRKTEPEMAVSKLAPPPECRPHKREAGKEKMMGYVARDKNGKLYFFPIYAKITKSERSGIWCVTQFEDMHLMPPLLFPEVEWEDEKPTEVEVTFRIREEQSEEKKIPKVLYDVEKMTVRDLFTEYNKATNRMYDILDTCEKENRGRTKEEELEYQVLCSYKDDIYRRAMEL